MMMDEKLAQLRATKTQKIKIEIIESVDGMVTGEVETLIPNEMFYNISNIFVDSLRLCWQVTPLLIINQTTQTLKKNL